MKLNIQTILGIVTFIRDCIPVIGAIIGKLNKKKAEEYKAKAEKAEKIGDTAIEVIQTYREIQKIKKDKKLPPDEKLDDIKNVAKPIWEATGLQDIVEKKVDDLKEGFQEKGKEMKKNVGNWLKRVASKIL